jgi:hypothetical protein
MIVPASKYLLSMLNTKVSDYYIRQLGVTRNGGYFEYKPMFVCQVPVPLPGKIKSDTLQYINESNCINEDEIDTIAYSIYNFTKEEVAYIENFLSFD